MLVSYLFFFFAGEWGGFVLSRPTQNSGVSFACSVQRAQERAGPDCQSQKVDPRSGTNRRGDGTVRLPAPGIL